MRKFLLFFVEGKSDRMALEIAIPALYDRIDKNIEVRFLEFGTDITCYDKDWINKKIHNILDDFCKKEKIDFNNITNIIHIGDTDGTFISDEMVRLDKEPDRHKALYQHRTLYYEKDQITCINDDAIGKIKERNATKSNNLNWLSRRNEIEIEKEKIKIPYKIYYFSCNLDHFLHKDQNLGKKNKCIEAKKFADRYNIGKELQFAEDISNDSDAIHGMNYEKSWEFIKLDNNSLKRHTNFNLLLEKLLQDIEKNQ